MEPLSKRLCEREVPAGNIAIYWLCQAGFALKTSAATVVMIDPYLSDVVERVIGFKRLTLAPLQAEEVEADLVLCTHEHLDHMDIDALPVLANTSRTHFAGPVECMKRFADMGLPPQRCHLLEEGVVYTHEDVTVTPVFADHGKLAPDALGLVVAADGVTIYHTGDTSLRPDRLDAVRALMPDVVLPCINGEYGNMDARQAAELIRLLRPRIAVPTHFWMFAEQNGNPKQFMDNCKELAPDTRILLSKPGEEILIGRSA
jgi:L-ascorbate 6-phosphate lactonase